MWGITCINAWGLGHEGHADRGISAGACDSDPDPPPPPPPPAPAGRTHSLKRRTKEWRDGAAAATANSHGCQHGSGGIIDSAGGRGR